MRAITVVPGQPERAELAELPEPEPEPGAGELLVETVRLGVCGTDREILDGVHGEPPEGRDHLVLGHELLGRVREGGQGFEPGDLVAGIVRRPDPVPCACCAQGEWDMCRNGLYTERGIKRRDGYGSELVTLEADFAVKVDPELGELGVLTEPASVLAKAWEQIDRIRTRACSPHQHVLVTGAGPIGLLAALMGVQRGFEVHVIDRAQEGIKPELVRDLGAGYHTGPIEQVCDEAQPDVIVECTGVAQLVVDAMSHTAPGAVVCLTGVASSRTLTVDVGALNNELVLENDVVFGSVNAARRHFEQAAESLRRADRDWLARVITRRVPLERWNEALDKGADDIKVVVEFAS